MTDAGTDWHQDRQKTLSYTVFRHLSDGKKITRRPTVVNLKLTITHYSSTLSSSRGRQLQVDEDRSTEVLQCGLQTAD